MKQTNLQNDNKIEKKKKKGFFDYDDALIATKNEESCHDAPEKVIKVSESENRRFRIGFTALVIVLVALLLFSVVFVGLDFLADGQINGIFDFSREVTNYKIYAPDWKTDIFTLDEYLALSPDTLMYCDDGVANVSFKSGEINERSKLGFVNSYFEAIKHGDSEKLNSLFTDECLAKNGRFSAFPMQKVYNIQIERLPKGEYIDSEFEGKVYEYCYFTLTYNIYRNDGLFCAEVDETHAREEGILVVFDRDGNGKIAKRTDIRYVKD